VRARSRDADADEALFPSDSFIMPEWVAGVVAGVSLATNTFALLTVVRGRSRSDGGVEVAVAGEDSNSPRPVTLPPALAACESLSSFRERRVCWSLLLLHISGDQRCRSGFRRVHMHGQRPVTQAQ
jgi:hypothetical protein